MRYTLKLETIKSDQVRLQLEFIDSAVLTQLPDWNIVDEIQKLLALHFNSSNKPIVMTQLSNGLDFSSSTLSVTGIYEALNAKEVRDIFSEKKIDPTYIIPNIQSSDKSEIKKSDSKTQEPSELIIKTRIYRTNLGAAMYTQRPDPLTMTTGPNNSASNFIWIALTIEFPNHVVATGQKSLLEECQGFVFAPLMNLLSIKYGITIIQDITLDIVGGRPYLKLSFVPGTTQDDRNECGSNILFVERNNTELFTLSISVSPPLPKARPATTSQPISRSAALTYVTSSADGTAPRDLKPEKKRSLGRGKDRLNNSSSKPSPGQLFLEARKRRAKMKREDSTLSATATTSSEIPSDSAQSQSVTMKQGQGQN